MTRLSPIPERGPAAQPHIRPASNIIVGEFSVHICYIQHSINMTVVQCVQLRRGQIYGQGSDPNVSYSGLSTSTMCSN